MRLSGPNRLTIVLLVVAAAAAALYATLAPVIRSRDTLYIHVSSSASGAVILSLAGAIWWVLRGFRLDRHD